MADNAKKGANDNAGGKVDGEEIRVKAEAGDDGYMMKEEGVTGALIEDSGLRGLVHRGRGSA